MSEPMLGVFDGLLSAADNNISTHTHTHPRCDAAAAHAPPGCDASATAPLQGTLGRDISEDVAIPRV
eukprot:1194015-Pyramimonas_sp.AAC.1